MVNEKQLRDFLVSAFELLREQNSALHSLMLEIAAVRDTLCAIGPKYKELLDQRKEHYVEEAKPSAFDDLKQYDEIIQQLKDASV